MEFVSATKALVEATHWVSGLEVQVLFAAALLTARTSLFVVVPQFPECFGIRAFDGIQATIRRGVKVELHCPAAQLRVIENDETYRAIFKGAEIVAMTVSGEWCGFSADNEYVVAGASRGDGTVLGRCDSFFGVLLTHEDNSTQLLRDFSVKGVVTVKQKKRTIVPSSGR